MRDWEDHWSRRDTPWDKGEAAPPLFEYLEEWDDGFMRGARVLVPGCGSGHDVRALAGAGAKPVGVDVSETAIEVARAHDPSGDEEFRHGSLFDWEETGYDALWEHTCFCAIDPADRANYARAAGRVVKPGGRLVGVFYLNPDNDGDGPPFGADRAEICRHFEPWFSLVRSRVPERAFPSRVGREWLAVFQRKAEATAGLR